MVLYLTQKERTVLDLTLYKALSAAANGSEELFMENRYICQDVSDKWIEWKVKSILEKYRFYAVGRDSTHLCTSCKKIRDDMGNWNHIEAYSRDHAELNHGTCPECAKKFIWNNFNK